ncbi:solute carrier family 22 member 10 isoform X4 [Mustela lutreola]|uniref:Solute carrier family 22 member 10 isoform X4 n=1 Tax=Mustela putorius furo TaxID=9669 RepID=A0A8U0N7B0_MUSPF|nr:solute carrier family 22 member 10 isoform X4 [Mustela putorius furo]XP_059001033.1 solute carrier family 22 member 10 isoform X4 [Mustela lutreola]
MAFQELLDQVGGLGKFQILQMVLIVPFLVMTACQMFLENFTTVIPGHRCWVHTLDNDTVSDNDSGILSPETLLRIFIPLDSDLRPEKCHRFIHPQWQLLHLNGSVTNMTEPDKETCLDGWVYDQSSFPSTIVTEWDLVCNYQSQKSVVQSLFMAGMLVGGLIGGHLSDRFGRKLILRWCLLQLTIVGTSAAFVSNFHIYCLLRFLSGCSSIIILANDGMLITEWIRPPSRVMVITVISCAFSVGHILLGGLAFVFREWRTLQLVVSVPFLVFFFSSRWLVESARWLIINNKPEEGLEALRKVAYTNGMQNAGDALTMENHMGRRTTQTLFMFLVGLSVLVNTFVPQEMQTLRVALASVGISCAAASVTSFGVHMLELIPTVLRARAFGLETVASRCGATLAPLLMMLMEYLSILPWIIYGVSPIIAGLAVLILPETRNLPLLDTLHDVKNNKEFSRKVNEINSFVKVTKF